MHEVLMNGTHICPYCRMAERLLKKRGISIKRIVVDEAPERRAEMKRITGRMAVPQIFVGDTHVGGYAELVALDCNGDLDVLLAAAAAGRRRKNELNHLRAKVRGAR